MGVFSSLSQVDLAGGSVGAILFMLVKNSEFVDMVAKLRTPKTAGSVEQSPSRDPLKT